MGDALPAGLCAFPGYLSDSEACEGVPALTHAVLLADVAETSAAETWVTRYVDKLAPGYPMVLTSDELPLEGAARVALVADGIAPRGAPSIRVVAGLFASEAAAERFNRETLDRGGQVRKIRGPPDEYAGKGDYLAFERKHHVAVEIVHPAPAFADAHVKDVGLNVDVNDARWRAGRQPLCMLHAGQVFVANRASLYAHQRRLAPVTCEGVRAWVPWTATRVESVVRVERDGPQIYQVLDVMCDSPTIARVPFVFGAALPAPRSVKGR
jgi:hypothetical protein